MRAKTFALVTVSAMALAQVAQADVEINTKPTANMSCNAGVCTATAQKAVLNVSDLANMLASGDVAVKTGLVAKDIEISQPLTWSNTSRLTLDAQQSVTIKKQVTVAGQGALTVITNDTGGAKGKSKPGEFIIIPEHGSVQFWDLGSSLIIDGNAYTLAGDIKTLASDIAANPSGFYALAKPYDASVDGPYTTSPISTHFSGIFDGLGNAISHFTMRYSDQLYFGFFHYVETGGTITNAEVTDADFLISGGDGQYGDIAILVLANFGLVKNSLATGSISLPHLFSANVGGLIAENLGDIRNSRSKMKIRVEGLGGILGGLTGANAGSIQTSYSSGKIAARSNNTEMGGLLGYNIGSLENTYTRTNLSDGVKTREVWYGGLIGDNENGAKVVNSYAAGAIVQRNNMAGGVVGLDNANDSFSYTYWDLGDGVSDPAKGAANKDNDPGITGLTDSQLKSGLPSGFSPKVWGQSYKANDGLPFLKTIPPS